MCSYLCDFCEDLTRQEEKDETKDFYTINRNANKVCSHLSLAKLIKLIIILNIEESAPVCFLIFFREHFSFFETRTEENMSEYE